MKKFKVLIATLFTGLFGLTSCELDLGFVRLGNKTEQKVKEDAEETPEQKENESSDSPSGSEESESSSVDPVFSFMKEYVTNVYTSVYFVDAEELVFEDYATRTEDSNADIYYHNKPDLMFVDADLYVNDCTFVEFITELISYLPEDAEYQTDLSLEFDEEYGDCDLWYKSGDFYYVIYGEDDYLYIWATFDILPVSHYDAYLEMCYDDEDDWDWDDDWDDDWNEDDWDWLS